MKPILLLEGVRAAGADIDGPYRYRLWRDWRPNPTRVCWVMLNPSTADETVDDPTIRRCIAFSKAWGYTGIVVVNLFALRATEPDDLLLHHAPIGPRNDDAIREAASACPLVVVAWGAHKAVDDREREVLEILVDALDRESPLCLGTTKDGFPRHPLYVRADAKLVPYAEVCS